MAGTGKSTIARTVCKRLAAKGVLGASFFFNKNEADRSHASMVFTTVAAHLVRKLPQMAPHTHQALEKDSLLRFKALQEQWNQLIAAPLSKVKLSPAPRLVIVLDALDECNNSKDVRALISMLALSPEISSVSVRIFLTSRPELPIEPEFNKLSPSTHRDIRLHEVPKPVIEHDIALYLESEFSGIRNDHSLPQTWPGKEKLRMLVDVASPLFIYAATLCRFVGDEDSNESPEVRLENVLRSYDRDTQVNPTNGRLLAVDHTSWPLRQMEQTYRPILDQILLEITDPKSKIAFLKDFKIIVGSIILLADPLPIPGLSRLLGIEENSVRYHLRRFNSVLSIPRSPQVPVTLLHLSFREFLVDGANKGCHPFWCDAAATHLKLASLCLGIMADPSGLRKNLCDLNGWGTRKAEIDQRHIDSCLSSELAYACNYWIYHLSEAASQLPESMLEDVDRFLRTRFLNWLEAMSLMAKMNDVIHQFSMLKSLIEVSLQVFHTFVHVSPPSLRYPRQGGGIGQVRIAL
jgi:hypothetical protein